MQRRHARMPFAGGPRPSIAPPDIVADGLIVDTVDHQEVILILLKRLPYYQSAYAIIILDV